MLKMRRPLFTFSRGLQRKGVEVGARGGHLRRCAEGDVLIIRKDLRSSEAGSLTCGTPANPVGQNVDRRWPQCFPYILENQKDGI